MKKCPYCSAELLDDAEFCLHCMRQLKEKTAIESKKKKRYFLIAIIGALAAVLACGLIILLIKFGASREERDISSNAESAITHTSENIATDNEAAQIEDNSSYESASSEKGTQVEDGAGTQSGKPQKPVTNKNSSKDVTTINSATGDGESSNDNKPTVNSPSSESGSSEVVGNLPTEEEDATVETPATPTEPTVGGNEEDKATQVWSVKSVSGGVEITGIATKNASGNYEIPAKIDGKTVVGIGQSAFYYEQTLKSVILPNTLKYIDEQAFAYCDSLTSIKIPDSVTQIGNNAFLPCAKLSDIYIASTNISIANYAFSNQNQRSVTLTIHAPSSVMNSMKAKIYWNAEYAEWNG